MTLVKCHYVLYLQMKGGSKHSSLFQCVPWPAEAKSLLSMQPAQGHSNGLLSRKLVIGAAQVQK